MSILKRIVAYATQAVNENGPDILPSIKRRRYLMRARTTRPVVAVDGLSRKEAR